MVLLTLLSVLCLSSCSSPSLSSFTEFLDNESKASVRLGIEQEGEREVYGQRIVMSWSIPNKMRNVLPAHLRLFVYYGDGTVEKFIYDIHQCSGYRICCLKGEEYCRRQGIVSYKISLFSGEKELVSRCHHLWTEILSV